MTLQAIFSGSWGDQRFEGAPVGRAREELVAIDEVQECQGLSTQRVDDMAVVDHLVVCRRPEGPVPLAVS